MFQGLISLSSPPMMPPELSEPAGSVTRIVYSGSLCLMPSRVVKVHRHGEGAYQCAPGHLDRSRRRACTQKVIVKGMVRLAHFQHDVVADVNNDVDRPLAGQAQTVLHPEGTGYLGDTLDQNRHEIADSAQVRP